MVLESVASLDPALIDDAYRGTVLNQLFSKLVRFDANLNILPDLAESWTISRDGLLYTFELRRDATFHDGTPVTAQDVVYSLTRLVDKKRIPPGIIQPYLRTIDGVDDFEAGESDRIRGLSAPDSFTVEIRLAEPYPSFLSVLCMDQAKIVPAEAVERMGAEEFGRHPVGSGPFRLVSWEPGEKIVLTGYRNYFGSPAHLDTVIFCSRHGKMETEEKADFFDGKLEAREIRGNQIGELAERGNYPVVRRLQLSLEFLGFDTALPPFDDVRVRKAVAMALDRDELAQVAGSGFQTPAGLLPPGMPGFTPESKLLPYDLDRARRLLAQAGYGPDRPLRFALYSATQNEHGARRDSVIVASMKRIGVEAVLHRVTWLDFLTAVNGRKAPAFVLTWIADVPDPDSFLFTLLMSGGSYNLFDYSNARVDSLLGAGRHELNVQERLSHYREAERLVLNDAPLVPLFNTMIFIALQPEVRGFEMSPLGIASIPLEKVWLEHRSSEAVYAVF